MSESGFVAVLVIDLHFPEAGSLKSKRKELSSIKAQMHARLGVSAAEVASLATLPPEDVLRGQVLGAIVAPLTTLAGLLDAPLRNLVGLIDARIEQLGGAEAADAPAEQEPLVEESPAAEDTQASADEETEASDSESEEE